MRFLYQNDNVSIFRNFLPLIDITEVNIVQ
jgi:hypothetical protein